MFLEAYFEGWLVHIRVGLAGRTIGFVGFLFVCNCANQPEGSFSQVHIQYNRTYTHSNSECIFMLTIKLLVDWMYLFVGFFPLWLIFLFCFDKDQRDGDNVVPEIYSFQLNIF